MKPLRFFFSIMCVGPIGTAACNVYGARPVVMIGGFLSGLGFILASQATTLSHLYLTMGLISGKEWCSVCSLYDLKFTFLLFMFIFVRYRMGFGLHPYYCISNAVFYHTTISSHGPGLHRHRSCLFRLLTTFSVSSRSLCLAWSFAHPGRPKL